MNETELKMIDYMQGVIDDAKEYRLSDDYAHSGVSRDMVRLCLECFEHCSRMFEAVTGKAVTFKNWKVVVKGE